MTMRQALSALLAVSLASAPVAVSAATAEASRTGATVEGEHLNGGMGAAWLVAAVIAVLLGIVLFTDDDEGPVSP